MLGKRSVAACSTRADAAFMRRGRELGYRAIELAGTLDRIDLIPRV
jgi:hypothetical protein